MIAILLAAATPGPIATLPGGDKARFEACVALTRSDPDHALAQADQWASRARTVPARECLGLALVAAGRWAAAAMAFDQAATGAEADRDGRAATLWTQAGNAALAANDPERARTYLDRALAIPALTPVMQGEAWYDRARADVAVGDLPLARIDLDKGLKLAGEDPFGWLLPAALARRQNDLARAATDIQKAAELAPDDASVALEAGNIAAASGAPKAAAIAWAKAAQLAPDEPEGKAAAQALANGAAPADGPNPLDYSLTFPAGAKPGAAKK